MPGGWEYKGHPQEHTVAERTVELVRSATGSGICALSYLLDTRPRHAYMFALVVPQGEPAFAGGYRGSKEPYLQIDIGVVRTKDEIPDRFHRGTPYPLVASEMHTYHQVLRMALAGLQQRLPALATKEQKLLALAEFTGIFFATFVEIHPYANGNGHISRLIVRCIFEIFNITYTDWETVKRNGLPPDEHITEFRKGNQYLLIDDFFKLLKQELTAN